MISLLPRYVRSEEQASSHINIHSHYDDVTLLDKSDKLIQIIQLNGLDCISRDAAELDAYKNRLNNLLKGISSDFAIYCWESRKRVKVYPGGDYPENYAKELNERYKLKIDSAKLFQNDLYLAVMTRQPEAAIDIGFSFLRKLKEGDYKEARFHRLAKSHADLCSMTRKIMSAMSEYGCQLLSVYEKEGIRFSEPLEFISQIINLEPHSIQMTKTDASVSLPRRRFTFNNRAGIVELLAADGNKRYAAMLSIKGYSPRTAQGMLNEISKLKCEYLITQSFRFYDRQKAKRKVLDQQKDMQQTNNESVTQIDQLDDSFDETASGEVGLGLHHFTMAVYADNVNELNQHIGLLSSKFADLDMICVREDIASECAFWSQLPGNFGYALRAVPITTRNMAGLASFHNYYRGKLSGNYWGDAVTVFETMAGTPYYFNFHHKDVGNFLIFGAMGSGKTLLTGFLIAQSMKFGGKRVIFDKDRGLEIFVRAMGGVYEHIKPGMPTGFNPCQLDDTPENCEFITSLFCKMLTVNKETLSAGDREIIAAAINGMYRLDKWERQLCHIASFFGTRKAGSLRNRFDQWHSDGQFAWLFGNEKDSLNLHPDVQAFDLGNILNDPVCKTPAVMYLLYRVQQAMAGQKGIIFADEGWNILNDPVLVDFVNDSGRTSRKKNIIFGLATQTANDTASSSISKALNESAHCKFFFPNPSADRTVYIDNLGLTENQYNLVKYLPDDQHYFVLVHGHGENQETVVARPDLSNMFEDIAIISGRESNLFVFDKIRAETGNRPSDWLEVFKTKMRNSQ
jgi:type IV secretion system protein VirB4